MPSARKDAERLAARLGGSALALDITAADAGERIAGALPDGLDVLVHNAGVTRDRRLVNMPAERWSSVLEVNLASVLRTTDALLARGTLREGGRIVATASIAGLAGNAGQTNYAASKAGVAGLVRALAPHALDGHGVTVNAVAPGFIETRMTAAVPFLIREAGRRMNSLAQGGLPADVAETTAWLAHPASGAVNGQVVRVCGQSLLGGVMTTRTLLTAPPALAPLLARGALLSPFKRPRPDAGFPATRMVLPGLRVDLARLAAYERVCGFPTGDDALPLTYPHVLGFPLAMRLMSGRDFPLPLLGLVHTSIEIIRHGTLPATGSYELSVHVDRLVPHRRGTEAVVVTELREAGAESGPVWESTSRYLARHRTPGARSGASGGAAPGAGCGTPGEQPPAPRPPRRRCPPWPSGGRTPVWAAATVPSPVTATRSICIR
ncbi:hypothetical protein GCM10020256_31470 [Streptomyces thermocoprophilus]